MSKKRSGFADPRNCQICGKSFTPQKSDVAIGNGRFCSRECVYKRKFPVAEKHSQWKRGKSLNAQGYWYICESLSDGYSSKREHRIIAEKALCKILAPSHPVHHVDGDRSNNANSNLVICENQTYHFLLHRRAKIIAIGGDPALHKLCRTCRKLLPHASFSKNKSIVDGLAEICKICRSLQRQKYRASRVDHLEISKDF